MHRDVEIRCIRIAEYILETKCTIRVAAKHFEISKSLVFTDITKRLPQVNKQLHQEVTAILEYHKSIRHLNGGRATKEKFQNLQVQKEKAKEWRRLHNW